VGTNIEWCDEVWNPVTGCSRISAGCANCYAHRAAKRLAGRFGYPADDPMRVVCHPERLDKPQKWRKPRRVFVCSMSDPFHEDVPRQFLDRMFDVMWHCSQHTFLLLTKRVEALRRYIRERASRLSHGWTDLGRTPLEPGEFRHYEDIVYRNECGYVGAGYWACDHPKNDEPGGEDTCHPSECPLAFVANSREQLAKIGVADEYEFDGDGYADDCEWMELHGRPRHAAVRNLHLGFSAANQATFNRRMWAFKPLRWELGPYIPLFVSLEPLTGPVDFVIPWGPPEDYDAGEKPPRWNALESHVFECAGDKFPVPHLNGVIVGCESGPRNKARPMKLDWVRKIRDQCAAAKVPFFLKQVRDAKGNLAKLPELDGHVHDALPAVKVEAAPRMQAEGRVGVANSE
jgi:protein gp37